MASATRADNLKLKQEIGKNKKTIYQKVIKNYLQFYYIY